MVERKFPQWLVRLDDAIDGLEDLLEPIFKLSLTLLAVFAVLWLLISLVKVLWNASL